MVNVNKNKQGEKQMNKSTEKNMVNLLNTSRKGHREVIKQIASRGRAYLLSTYVNAVKKATGNIVRKSDITRCLTRISGQYGFTNIVVTGERVYNYSMV